MNLHPNGSINKSLIRKFQQQSEFGEEERENNFEDKENNQTLAENNGELSMQQQQLSLEQIICEDLHAFEHRLIEILQDLEPKTKRWRWILVLSIISTLITATQWLLDVETFECSFWQSLWNHHWFTINCFILISLFLLFGIHRRVIQQNIIAQRIRDVIGQFNMGCDDHGRLILMPRPPSFYNLYNNNHYLSSYYSNGFR